MGIGNEYKNSIIGHLEGLLGSPSNNLGVGSYSFLQINLALKKHIKLLLDTKIYIFYASWLINRSIKDRATAVTYRPILARSVKNKQIILNRPNNPPLFLVKLFIVLFNSKILFKNFILKLIIGISMIYHGVLNRLIAKIFNLQKWKRLDINEDRDKILEYCLNDLLNIAKKYNKEITLIHLPACNKKIKSIKELSLFDQKIISKFAESNNLINYFYLNETEKEFSKYFDKNEIDEIFWSDTNHPNNKGSRIIAEEISKLIK